MTLQNELYWVPGQRVMLHAMFGAQVLVLDAQRDSTDYALSKDDPRELDVKQLLAISERLTNRMTRLMEWSLGQLARVQADLGAMEHNAKFGAIVAEDYFARMRELANDAFLARPDYLPNLAQTLWGNQARRAEILQGLFHVMEALPDGAGVHAMDLAGALEEAYGSNIRQANWTNDRMFGLSPEERRTSRRGLLPPGTKGVSYEHLRVVRTEMAGLQQQMAWERYSHQPWVVGWDWKLSPNHPMVDICDTLADESPYPMHDQPRIPHPNCLCYVTPRDMPDADFAGRVRGWLDDGNDFLDNYAAYIQRPDPIRPLVPSKRLGQWNSGVGIPNSPQRLPARYKKNLKRYAANIPVSGPALRLLRMAKQWNGTN